MLIEIPAGTNSRGLREVGAAIGLWPNATLVLQHIGVLEELKKLAHVPPMGALRDVSGGALKIIDYAPRFQQHGRVFRPTMLVRMLVPLAGSPRVRRLLNLMVRSLTLAHAWPPTRAPRSAISCAASK